MCHLFLTELNYDSDESFYIPFTGECICIEPYAGRDCSVDRNHVPILHDLPFQGICDKVERPCLTSPTYGDLFIESENLMCKTTILDVSLKDFLPTYNLLVYTWE